jgi:hypothetical protein
MKRTNRPVEQAPKPGRRPLPKRILNLAWQHRCGRRDSLNRIGMELQELTDDGVGVEADRMRVGADERTPKNTRRPAQQVISLQPLEERKADLRLLRDGGKRDLLSFTLLAKSSAETFGHATPRGPRTGGQR